MTTRLIAMLAIVSTGCSSPTEVLNCSSPTESGGPLHTIVAFPDEASAALDLSLFCERGARSVQYVAIVSVVVFRAESAVDFKRIRGVTGVWDFGEDEDPRISVWVRLKSDVTDEDAEYLRSLGAQTYDSPLLPNGVIPTIPRSIPVKMRLGGITALGEWNRVESVFLPAPGATGATGFANDDL